MNMSWNHLQFHCHWRNHSKLESCKCPVGEPIPWSWQIVKEVQCCLCWWCLWVPGYAFTKSLRKILFCPLELYPSWAVCTVNGMQAAVGICRISSARESRELHLTQVVNVLGLFTTSFISLAPGLAVCSLFVLFTQMCFWTQISVTMPVLLCYFPLSPRVTCLLKIN